jgi:DNA-binding LacI/PurR family transcriptional regulator
MGINIFDIAKEANVSIATVSKVANNTGKISQKTKIKVMEIIKKHNYTPNSLATALTGKLSYTLGLIIPNMANPFFGEISKSVEDRARELGFSVMICSTDYNAEREASCFTLLQRKRVDGVIILSGFEDQQTITRNLVTPNMPIALIARDIPTISIHSVSIDDFVGGYEAAKHLLGLNHRRIGLIVEDIRCAKERLRGFNQALEDQELQQLDESLVLLGEASVQNGKKLALQLLKEKEPPTAIFATNDLLAIGTMQAAHELGLKVPQDLSVIGFDNTVLATITDPPLTTVAQPMEQMGRQILDLLVQEIKGELTHKHRIVLLPELVVRKSTTER